jgi:hypothetical protein
MKTIERFLNKVDKNGPSGCWIWTAAKSTNDYGKFSVGNHRSDYAHRVSYKLFVGKIPKGLQVNHLCGVKLCVNPDHLEAGDQTENMRHCVHIHKMHYTPALSGENHGRAKLTKEEVNSMREEYRAGITSYPKLAKKYNVGVSQCFRIIKMENWRD